MLTNIDQVAAMSEAAAALGRKDADRWLAKAVIDIVAAEAANRTARRAEADPEPEPERARPASSAGDLFTPAAGPPATRPPATRPPASPPAPSRPSRPAGPLRRADARQPSTRRRASTQGPGRSPGSPVPVRRAAPGRPPGPRPPPAGPMSLVTPTGPVPLEDLGRVHFAGIGGAGMSGIARIMLARGVSVSGSDSAASAALAELGTLGARVHVGHRAEYLGDADTLVVSSAIRQDNPELAEARRRGIRVLHRAGALASLMFGRRVIAVTGTHGKTTTTSMITTVLRETGADPGYVIGGVLAATGVGAADGAGRDFVAEADESDGSFLMLAPDAAVVTNVEADHLDNYGTARGVPRVVRRVRRADHARRAAGHLRRRPRRARAGRPGPRPGAAGAHLRGVGGRGLPGDRDANPRHADGVHGPEHHEPVRDN